MIYNVEIRPDALADIAEAATWYDEREPGVGLDFVRATREAIGKLSANPLAHGLRIAAARSAGCCHLAFLIEFYTASTGNASPSSPSSMHRVTIATGKSVFERCL